MRRHILALTAATAAAATTWAATLTPPHTGSHDTFPKRQEL